MTADGARPAATAAAASDLPTELPPPLERFLHGQPRLATALPGIARAAAASAPLLLIGEAGTGRTALARAIHAASPRAGQPLIETDPGAVPAALFEAEFFGYRAGAFTGAAADTPGRVERAAGGTLVLDHVEELPVATQPKLLRLLSEGRFQPLGGAERQADVRVVALGPEDLPERVRQGAFRADLYYRLEVFAFRLPPLRERTADLPVLVERLLADLGERFGRHDLALAPAALPWILEHPWPGNLRQLKNTLERAVVMTAPGSLLAPEPPAGGVRPRPLVELEAAEIRRALAYTRGHQGRAAKLLGISRKALWQKRKRFGIP